MWCATRVTRREGVAACVSMCLAVSALSSCAHVPARTPVPLELVGRAEIPGVPDARAWGDAWPQEFIAPFQVSDEELRSRFPAIYGQPHNYLALSGGGANGAFGAGLLVGWTAAGTRPKFTMVTGISTGALTAPFAFLGSDYDDALRAVYTTSSTKDIETKKGLLAALRGISVADTSPLRRLIGEYMTPAVVEAIAREHRTGRRLWIGTVNLDAGRPVIWNLGAIAASDDPDKVQLVRDVLLASSAMPVVFPPVLIPVEANGHRYDEMHVDGGTASQVWVYPAAVDWRAIVRKLKVVGRPQVYVIRNAALEPSFATVEPKTKQIATRAISSLIRTQGIGDLYKIYGLCERDGNDFNLVSVPSDFADKPTEAFDRAYMGKLFDVGYRLGATGDPWQHEPSGFNPESTALGVEAPNSEAAGVLASPLVVR